ncbi:DUF3298 and DUF4163 domain-containing protein [uncultured Microbulbifer sp.]|uniref:DUF3298 and DUF4163 domain-containing protein n=1 Tax=uncultured Microbulbifer sp. TaxID=348147 RepID=UPI0025F0E57C|nr:DUF3298 and DUF4163 domain-containing protein [uncultured Microbulbifer sp.]
MWIMNTAGKLRFAANLAALSVLLLTLAACDRPSASKQAPLESEVQTFERLAPDCQQAEDCTSVSITREVFAGRPALNAAVSEQLLMQLQGNGEAAPASGATSLEQVADAFIQQAGEVAGISAARWQLSGDAKKLARHGNLLTVTISSYMYSGGAHGIPATHWLNWDLAADKAVTLADLIQPGQEQAFWKLAEEAHRNWLESQKLGDDFRENWPFAHSEDFRLTGEGLKLLYGVYTIAPYSMGEVELMVPRAQLGEIVRAGYLSE